MTGNWPFWTVLIFSHPSFRSELRNWCEVHGLGRRVGGGTWSVSKVALTMFLDGDEKALLVYHAGDRSSEP
jgi:hypothetical protein